MSDDLKPYMYRLGSFDAYENALREAGAEHQRTIESLRGRNIECVKLQSRVTDLEAKLKVAICNCEEVKQRADSLATEAAKFVNGKVSHTGYLRSALRHYRDFQRQLGEDV